MTPSLHLVIAGRPVPESDAEIARFLERFLERERPGTSWIARRPEAAGPQTRSTA